MCLHIVIGNCMLTMLIFPTPIHSPHTHTLTHSHTTCFQVRIGTNIDTVLDDRLIYEVVPDPVALEIIIPAVISGVLLLTLPFAFIIIMVLCIMRRKQRAVLFNFEMTDREIRYYSKIRQPKLYSVSHYYLTLYCRTDEAYKTATSIFRKYLEYTACAELVNFFVA